MLNIYEEWRVLQEYLQKWVKDLDENKLSLLITLIICLI